MDNKLSELSKPVAQAYYDEHDSSVMLIDWLVDYVPEAAVLYSQEYVSALLADNEAKDKRIADLEAGLLNSHHRLMNTTQNCSEWERKAIRNFDECANMSQRIEELEAKLATPVRLMGEMLLHDWEHSVERQAAFQHRKTAWDARLEEDKKAIRAAGFTFTVEGDE
ncbi:hypothetical protein AB6825_22745 [Serratia proteamaculans]|uniref:hypothetical protein n=1 Tax=Serratia proteamaculans TaxID=28151 RepID=UPI0039BE9C75